jgi:hypothetical protein
VCFIRPIRSVLVLIAVLNVPVGAQSATHATVDRHPAYDERSEPRLRAATPWHGRILTALSGAALGAGVGFFASQVVRGDWDDGAGGVDRPTWAAVGGSLGFAIGLSFPVAGQAQRPDVSRTLPRGRFVIGADELQRTGVKSAAEAVQLLRPEWLRERGTHILGEGPNETIQVYLDDVRLGGLRFLSDVAAATVRSIHFLDAAAATLRWGAGHSHGVILIIAEGGLPRTGGP